MIAAVRGWQIGRRAVGYAAPMTEAGSRHLLTAELLSIGSELTVGETRDTNAGELARWLTELGVRVARMTALPDDLAAVRRRSGRPSSGPTSWCPPAGWARPRTT